MSVYFDSLCEAMSLCAQRNNAIFLGQAVTAAGTAMHNTLKHLPAAQRLELPVAEEMQLGMSIGLSLQGYLPISIYPRINFLLLAVSQLVLHLDKIPLYSDYRPRVIIRTAIGSKHPLDPGPQHLGNYADAIGQMLDTVRVEVLEEAEEIMPAYQQAIEFEGSTILVERMERY